MSYDIDSLSFALKPVIELAAGSKASTHPSIYLIESATGAGMIESIALRMWPNRYTWSMATVLLIIDAS